MSTSNYKERQNYENVKCDAIPIYSIFFERETSKSHMWKCIKENNNVAFGQNQFDLNVVMDIPYKNLILKCTHDLKGCTTESIS